jgi:HlyD family secretion protein
VLPIAIIGLAIWYLARPEPLLVQGEAQSTRIDMAARVSGRLAKISVVRGQDVPAGATLLEIDSPELLAELDEAEAEKMVADAELARINVGTRSEIIAQRKAECRDQDWPAYRGARRRRGASARRRAADDPG